MLTSHNLCRSLLANPSSSAVSRYYASLRPRHSTHVSTAFYKSRTLEFFLAQTAPPARWSMCSLLLLPPLNYSSIVEGGPLSQVTSFFSEQLWGYGTDYVHEDPVGNLPSIQLNPTVSRGITLVHKQVLRQLMFDLARTNLKDDLDGDRPYAYLTPCMCSGAIGVPFRDFSVAPKAWRSGTSMRRGTRTIGCTLRKDIDRYTFTRSIHVVVAAQIPIGSPREG